MTDKEYEVWLKVEARAGARVEARAGASPAPTLLRSG
jgi:hypothetical protein